MSHASWSVVSPFTTLCRPCIPASTATTTTVAAAIELPLPLLLQHSSNQVDPFYPLKFQAGRHGFLHSRNFLKVGERELRKLFALDLQTSWQLAGNSFRDLSSTHLLKSITRRSPIASFVHGSGYTSSWANSQKLIQASFNPQHCRTNT